MEDLGLFLWKVLGLNQGHYETHGAHFEGLEGITHSIRECQSIFVIKLESQIGSKEDGLYTLLGTA